MKFSYNGKDYWIKFHHDQFTWMDEAGTVWVDARFIEGTDNAYARGTTECLIVTGTKDNEEVVARGIAHCSVWDQFDKETGRQLSLARAIGQGIKTAIFLKKDFKFVMGVYFARKRGAGIVPAPENEAILTADQSAG